MYQSLICAGVLRDDPRCLSASLDAEDAKRLTDALVHGVRRDMEFGRDFLGGEVPVDQAQTVELTPSEPCYSLGHGIVIRRAPVSIGGSRQARRLLHCKTHPARHCGNSPSNESRNDLI
jgi:hypothetical protein